MYPDDGAFTVTVRVRDDDGDVGSDTLTLVVDNVVPTLTVSGAASVEEGADYMLDLSASDPGADTITSWEINWGDGVVETISGNPSSVSHSYADGDASHTISATATDEDGTFDANSLDISVANVAPTVDISSPTSASVGETVTFTLTASERRQRHR